MGKGVLGRESDVRRQLYFVLSSCDLAPKAKLQFARGEFPTADQMASNDMVLGKVIGSFPGFVRHDIAAEGGSGTMKQTYGKEALMAKLVGCIAANAACIDIGYDAIQELNQFAFLLDADDRKKVFTLTAACVEGAFVKAVVVVPKATAKSKGRRFVSKSSAVEDAKVVVDALFNM